MTNFDGRMVRREILRRAHDLGPDETKSVVALTINAEGRVVT